MTIAGPTDRERPWWMTVAAVVCIAALLIWIPRDLFVPSARDVEVWFGFEIRGPLALLTAPIHWAIFGVAAWAFWTARPWIVTWAAGYIFYGALSHIVWSEASPNGRGWPIGVIQAVALSIVALLLLRVGGRQGAA